MSKGRALCLGVDGVLPTSFGGENLETACAREDAVEMAALASWRGFTTVDLLTPGAPSTGRPTVAAFKATMAEAADDLEWGDMFLLTFSGHGTVRLGERGPDEAWCLEDGLVFDDDLTMLLAAFKPGVRVWVISDSCYSGTMVDPVEAPLSRPEGVALSRKESLAPSQNDGSAPRSASLDAPSPVKLLRNTDTSQPLVEQAAIKSMLWRQQDTPASPDPRTARGGALSIKAAVLCLAACLDKNQTPRIPPARPGLPRKTFTRTLLNVWDDGHYPKSCWDLCHDAIASWVPSIELRPQPYWVGSGKPFGGQTPAFPIFVPPLAGRVRPPRPDPTLIRRPTRSTGGV